MVFSSILFLFWFMPAAFGIYYLTPQRYRNASLFFISLLFYSWGEIRYFPVMMTVILINYVGGLLIGKWEHDRGKARLVLIIALIISLGFLVLFKYADFLITNVNDLFGIHIPLLKLTLPLGISFYTFQIITYTVDVYRGTVKPARNFIDFGTFVVLFPQLIAGPIVKYVDIHQQLRERRLSLSQIQEGIAYFILGLGSKVLIANSVGKLWSDIGTIGYANISTPLAWIGIIAYILQLYFDFSGYSLMAIGLGHMLGFSFPQNFNYPYISRSITELWRRWHITLSGWFREYVYFPLGGSHGSKMRTVFNLLVVWCLTGLWHGANWNFLLWGFSTFVMIYIERLGVGRFLEKHRVFSHIYFVFFICVTWAVFAITDMSQVQQFYIGLFSMRGGADWLFYLRNYGIILVLAIVLSTPLLRNLANKVRHKWVFVPLLMCVFFLSVAYLVDETYNPFLYFRF